MRGLSLIIILMLVTGCAHVISDEMRARADENTDLRVILKSPEAYIGRTVILGGLIASSKNTDDGTFIEVLQKPLDSHGKPTSDDVSYGRFIIFNKGYLETNIYAAGRLVTVAGELTGTTEGKVGQMTYVYPIIKAEELRLHKNGDGGSRVRFSIGIWHAF